MNITCALTGDDTRNTCNGTVAGQDSGKPSCAFHHHICLAGMGPGDTSGYKHDNLL
jgi:hypothetical protein